MKRAFTICALLFSPAAMANFLDCDNIASIRLVVDLALDRKAPSVHETFDGTSFARAKATSTSMTSLKLSDSRGRNRQAFVFFTKEEPHRWRYYLATGGVELENYARSQSSDGLVILEQGFVEFEAVSGKLSRFVPFHIKPENDRELHAGEQAVSDNPLADENAESIRWTNSEPVDHILIEAGQNPKLLGSLVEGEAFKVNSLRPSSIYNRFCPPEYLHEQRPNHPPFE